MKKRVLTYILLAIFSIQLIPIKEIGKIFYGNQMIEEICHAIDSDCNNPDHNEDVKSKEFEHNKSAVDLTLFISTRLSSTPLKKCYASRLADDTPTRPPLELFV